MKVLIIGGAGFVGANLVRRCLVESGVQVTVLDSLDPLFQSTTAALQDVLGQIVFVQGDLRDGGQLQRVVIDQDIIFNCAGQTSHPFSLQRPLVDVEMNCLGNLMLLEAVRQYNPSATVVFTSSTTIVGRADRDTVDEDHAERPRDIYSANKGVAEKYYQIYHTVHDLKTVSLRLPNLFGPYGKSDPRFGFVNFFISLARKGQAISVYGDGNQKRNIMYVEDATEILWQAAHEPRLTGSIYLATGDEHRTVRDIAEQINACFAGGGIDPVAWPDDRRRIEIGSVEFSSARLRQITGWRPRYDLESGLQRTRDILDQGSSEPAP